MWVEATEAAKPLGHSWPSLHWWLSLSAADQGAWVSGLGAFGAIAVALFSVRHQGRSAEREARKREYTRALLLAAEGTSVMHAVHDELLQARWAISEIELSPAKLAALLPHIGIPVTTRLPNIHSYEGAPLAVAQAFARLISATEAYNYQATLFRQTESVTLEQLTQGLKGSHSLLDDAQSKLIVLTDLLATYDPWYRGFDFRQRSYPELHGVGSGQDMKKPAG